MQHFLRSPKTSATAINITFTIVFFGEGLAAHRLSQSVHLNAIVAATKYGGVSTCILQL